MKTIVHCSLVCLFAFLFVPRVARAQTVELFSVAPLGEVAQSDNASWNIVTPSIPTTNVYLELQLRLGETTTGLPGFSFSTLLVTDDLTQHSNIADNEPHDPGDTPLTNIPTLPTRPKKKGPPTLGNFVPDGESKVSVYITSKPKERTDDGYPVGPGTKVREHVMGELEGVDNPKVKPRVPGLPLDVWVACEHVEGHAAGILRQHNKTIKKATITINNFPCDHCQAGIPHILNDGQILIVEYVDPGFGDQDAEKKTGYWIGGEDGFHEGLPPRNGGQSSGSGGSDQSGGSSGSGDGG